MRFIYVLLMALASYGVYDYFYPTPLVGEWKSSWELTNKVNSHWNSEQRYLFKKVFGKMTAKATRDTWVGEMDGEIFSSTYEVLISANNCYQVQSTDTKTGEQENNKLCMVDGNIHYHVPKYNLIEVFVPQ